MDEFTRLRAALPAPRDHQRLLLGIVGAPGSGKSFVANMLAAALSPRGRTPAPVIEMDGFHLSNEQLDLLGLRAQKGAPASFDVEGLNCLLHRVRERGNSSVFAPAYDRALHEPVAARVRVDPADELAIVEGNYLLLPEGQWVACADALDLTVYLDVEDALRRERLMARHVAHGRTRVEALAWIDAVDDPNARRIAATRDRATMRIDGEALVAAIRAAR
ncbi:nucleoside/nucleotide kinase family protein [Rarobacter incanus]|uniref:Pantothenate kinase n=1 Tax=Rarobacter incanus TaxID=153494 RepID=A0A542SMG6_9MICO|nr:nucleoside/nucleotide kinase family protein [Rarobacter incanus]TQK75819.1 pantothenate kinase [Rarobacter incanus]